MKTKVGASGTVSEMINKETTIKFMSVRMKKGMIQTFSTLLFAVIIFAAPFDAHAKRVEPEKAEKLAQRFAESRHGQRGKADVRLRHTAKRQGQKPGGSGGRMGAIPQSAPEDAVSYYVFNINENGSGGFVIVAGNDAVKPVLGYSDNGSYDPDNLPPNFAYWMDYLQKQIAWAQEQDIAQSGDIRLEWEKYVDGADMPVMAPNAAEPLIKTQWAQWTPYNNMCPLVAGFRSATGCTATAMAQIMKYHRHPVRGTGQSASYTTATHGITIPPVNFDIDYDWDNMLDTYTGSASAVQENAVATLMYHFGVSMKMDYGPDGSKGNMNLVEYNALSNHFGYDAKIQSRELYYSDVVWKEMLKAQIDAGLPVYYAGSSTDTENNSINAHAFICDGYDNTGKFHFNWGWGGQYNGYFEISALNPDGYNFNDFQMAIMNIKPETSDITWYNSSETSFTITTAQQLAGLARLVHSETDMAGKTIKLGNNIALNDTANWRNWETVPPANSWMSIGGTINDKFFSGTFDGGGFVISGVYINSLSDSQGLFGAVGKSGVIKNLGVTASYIKGSHSAESPIGIGGLAGLNTGTITDCYASGNITGTAANGSIGGLVGVNYEGTITNSYADGDVSGVSHSVGGLLGNNNAGTITNSYAAGNVTGGASLAVGGLVGYVFSNSTIINSYATGNVAGDASLVVGGLAGYISNSTITNSYAAGNAAGGSSTAVGGLAGSSISGIITNCYYNNETAGMENYTNNLGTSKTMAELKQQETYTGWDFTNIWAINAALNDGYPHLRTSPVTSILSPNRLIPASKPEAEAAAAPVNVLTSEFTAGPNPAAKSLSNVNFFWQGKSIENTKLYIYDASGNLVRKINISDKSTGKSERREIGKWNLKDGKGRAVSAGTYLVKGVIKSRGGELERVSLVLGVR